jgi:hypothetical protein
MGRICITFFLTALFSSSCGVLTDLPSKKDGTNSLAVSSGRLSITQLKEKTLELKVGMRIEEVQELLGKPDFTEARTFGSETASGPWIALVWTYERKSGKYNTAKLKVVFEEGLGGRFLNSWDL